VIVSTENTFPRNLSKPFTKKASDRRNARRHNPSARRPAVAMQASLALAARFGTCVAGTFPLKRACRHPGALTPGRRPPSRRAAFASTADDSVGGGGSASATKASPGDTEGVSKRKGGKRDLAEAYGDIRAILTDPTRLVRAVASGKARGATPRWRRLEMRPVLLKKGGVKLQVVKYDERQAFTSNHAYAGEQRGARRDSRSGRRGGGKSDTGTSESAIKADASAAADEALALGFGSWRVESVDAVTQVRVTKSGEAQWHQTGQLLANARGVSRSGSDSGSGMRVAVANVASHDREKPRLLSPSDPFLRAVGVSSADGSSIKASRRDKYKQVEEFVKLVKLAVEEAQTGGHLATPSREAPARLVDLGCGNAYLTFGAFAHLSAVPHAPFHMEVVGVDIKRQSRETNTRVALDLGWDTSCVFVEGTIADAEVAGAFATARETSEARSAVDVVLALHACDTATDEALARAVRWRAPLTLVAPCCHHDLQVRMKRAAKAAEAGPPHPPLARHGILRERLGDVLTDAFRAHVLRLLGHRVDVTEWIGGEHTPRNTMIKAVRTNQRATRALWAEYDALVEDWGVTPRLAEMLAPELEEARAEAMRAEETV